MNDTTIALGVAVFVLLLLFLASVKIVPEYERGVIFRLGRVIDAKGPGLFFIIPVVDRLVRVSLRTVTMDVPSQDVITRDNVSVRVNAVAYFNVVDPVRSVVAIENYVVATSQIAQTTLRSILGQVDLDDLLTKRDDINQRLQQIIDETTNPWGVKVSVVEVKDVELAESMRRAMARQAEAERERRAKVIHAHGEFEAAETLGQAAEVLEVHPAAMQLRGAVDHGRYHQRANLHADLPVADGAAPARRHPAAERNRTRALPRGALGTRQGRVVRATSSGSRGSLARPIGFCVRSAGKALP